MQNTNGALFQLLANLQWTRMFWKCACEGSSLDFLGTQVKPGILESPFANSAASLRPLSLVCSAFWGIVDQVSEDLVVFQEPLQEARVESIKN